MNVALAATSGSRLDNSEAVGKIYTRKDGYMEYIVNSMKEMEIIINHFNNYPLITPQGKNYLIINYLNQDLVGSAYKKK